jgi:hypothetical protein
VKQTLELIATIANKWIEKRPFSKETRARKKAKRIARRKARRGEELTPEEGILMAGEISEVKLPSGEVVMREEPVWKKRVSTKTGGTAGVGTVVLGLVGVFFPEAMDSLTPEQAMWIGAAITTAVAWVTARFTRSPSKPGTL